MKASDVIKKKKTIGDKTASRDMDTSANDKKGQTKITGKLIDWISNKRGSAASK